MKRKLIAILILCVVLCTSIFGLTACSNNDSKPIIEISADGYWVINGEKTEYKANIDDSSSQSTSTEQLAFILNSDKQSYSVRGLGTYSDFDVVIPSEHNGLPVTGIATFAFVDCDYIQTITIPNSITSIGVYAFFNCRSLTSIMIGDNVSSIGEGAFHGCSSLTSIEIPDSVTSIGDNAFYGCNSLEYNIKDGLKYLGNDNNKYLYLRYTISTEIIIAIIDSDCKFIDGATFSDCSSLTSVTIPNNVTYIGNSAFSGCHSLTNIIIPNSLTYIGPAAFYGCSSLTSIIIPNSVTYIGFDAFENCNSLEYIYCKAESQPSGWHKDWNVKNNYMNDFIYHNVIWGYKGQ
ncbi:MAG: leucine-rich repeat domain-containing protein [Clostridiales bacterium]|nr:leucine-rich repeat domain-containing protein [Clostridiales bacterium]